MVDTSILLKEILLFRKKRDWKKFHNPKNLAISISLEASELLEKFQWLNDQESEKVSKNKKLKNEIAEELIDVLYYLLLLAYDLKIDINQAFKIKMRKNERNYPVHKAKGKSLKYDQLK